MRSEIVEKKLNITSKNCVYADIEYCVFELDSGYPLYDQGLAARQYVIYNHIHQHEVAFVVLQPGHTYFVDILTMAVPHYNVQTIEEAVRVSAREFTAYLTGGD
jgi:hypothetical protein